MQLPPPSTQHPDGLVPVSRWQWQPAGVAALLRAIVVSQCSFMTRDANQPPDWPSKAPFRALEGQSGGFICVPRSRPEAGSQALLE